MADIDDKLDIIMSAIVNELNAIKEELLLIRENLVE